MALSENAKEWIKDIVIAVVLAALILVFIKPTIVREHSMENTLHDGDYLFVSRQQYKLFNKAPQRGDIVVFSSDLESSTGANKLLIKRIIGVPGDIVEIYDGIVYVNDEALNEPYTKDGYTDSDMYPVEVPENCLFCMGDNRQNSTDSRDGRVGFISMDDVMGKAVFRIFPFNQIGTL